MATKAAYADVAARPCAADARVSSWTAPAPTLFAANLLTADSDSGPTALASAAYRAANQQYLSALVAMGVKAITMEVTFPTLTAAYYGSGGATTVDNVISFFTQTVSAAHAAGVKVAVLHNSVLPGFSATGLPDPRSVVEHGVG